MFRILRPCALLLTLGICLAAEPDLKDYRTVDKATAAKISAAGKRGAQTGYLGAAVTRDKNRLVVEDVQPNSPADKAGIKKGDTVLKVGEQSVRSPEEFREWLQLHAPDEEVTLTLSRDGKDMTVKATLAATSRPLGGRNTPRAYFGVQLGEPKENEGVHVDQVVAGSPAATAGLKTGDRINKIDGAEFTRAARLPDLLSEKKPGDVMTLTVRRDGKDMEMKVTLADERTGRRDNPLNTIWRKNVFNVAVILIEFPDVKHNDKVPVKDWNEMLLGKDVATKKEKPAVAALGSLNDYFVEQSAGAFHLEGKVFDWVEVPKKRGDYIQGSGTSNKTAPLTDALDKLTARDGRDALAKYDGLMFVYAGDAVRTNRGAVYYPHAGGITLRGKSYPYLLGPEGGSKTSAIGVFAKEFSQVLGIPDLAARTENIGSEGLGVWCAMSNPFTTTRPQHLSAWAKERLGWIKPTVIDPTVKQKLVLAPIENSPKECFKILVRPDGSEYFLLENRKKTGFDSDLPGEGLLIWPVVNDRPILEESHGVEGPSGPTVHLSAVPYPSASNNAFTPETTPSSRSPLGGGLPVQITEIRRLADGRITFHIGYEYR